MVTQAAMAGRMSLSPSLAIVVPRCNSPPSTAIGSLSIVRGGPPSSGDLTGGGALTSSPFFFGCSFLEVIFFFGFSMVVPPSLVSAGGATGVVSVSGVTAGVLSVVLGTAVPGVEGGFAIVPCALSLTLSFAAFSAVESFGPSVSPAAALSRIYFICLSLLVSTS
jgi:hypothetical protein